MEYNLKTKKTKELFGIQNDIRILSYPVAYSSEVLFVIAKNPMNDGSSRSTDEIIRVDLSGKSKGMSVYKNGYPLSPMFKIRGAETKILIGEFDYKTRKSKLLFMYDFNSKLKIQISDKGYYITSAVGWLH